MILMILVCSDLQEVDNQAAWLVAKILLMGFESYRKLLPLRMKFFSTCVLYSSRSLFLKPMANPHTRVQVDVKVIVMTSSFSFSHSSHQFLNNLFRPLLAYHLLKLNRSILFFYTMTLFGLNLKYKNTHFLFCLLNT